MHIGYHDASAVLALRTWKIIVNIAKYKYSAVESRFIESRKRKLIWESAEIIEAFKWVKKKQQQSSLLYSFFYQTRGPTTYLFLPTAPYWSLVLPQSKQCFGFVWANQITGNRISRNGYPPNWQPIIRSFETSVEKVSHLKPFFKRWRWRDRLISPCEWTGSVVVCCLLPVVINRSVEPKGMHNVRASKPCEADLRGTWKHIG